MYPGTIHEHHTHQIFVAAAAVGGILGTFLGLFNGINQTIQKNSVGFIPWDEITIGKHRIPWEKHRQSVLFYAPAPKPTEIYWYFC
jgi:hypothetical protein